MIYLICINEKTKQSNNNIGDCIAITTNIPTQKEYEKFNVYELDNTEVDLRNTYKNIIQENFKESWEITSPTIVANYDGNIFKIIIDNEVVWSQ
jgi:hypothetical protein